MPRPRIFICECCGREYKDKAPFPQGCACGNYNEDYFREKDIHDEADDKNGIPLLGVNYDPKVLAERNARLEKENK